MRTPSCRRCLAERFNEATACVGDQPKRSIKGSLGHALSSVVAIDKEAGDPIVGDRDEPCFILLSVVDPRSSSGVPN